MNAKEKDNDLFDLNPKTHYNFEPRGYLKPIDGPASELRAVFYVPNDSSKPAVDLQGPITQDYRQIPEAYLNYVNTKVNYLYK
jgi:hypothetical protein